MPPTKKVPGPRREVLPTGTLCATGPWKAGVHGRTSCESWTLHLLRCARPEDQVGWTFCSGWEVASGSRWWKARSQTPRTTPLVSPGCQTASLCKSMQGLERYAFYGFKETKQGSCCIFMISIKHAMLELVWQIFVAWENLLYPLPEIVECLTNNILNVCHSLT